MGSDPELAPEPSITKEGPASVEPGERFVYTLIVTNTGDAPATLVRVTDRLPEGVDLVRFHSDDFECKRDAAAQSGLIRCTGSLAAGETGTVEIVVEPEHEGSIENTAELRAGGVLVDEDTEETTAEETTVVDGQTVIIPDKLSDKPLPNTGGPGGIALATGCVLLGVGLIVNRIIR